MTESDADSALLARGDGEDPNVLKIRRLKEEHKDLLESLKELLPMVDEMLPKHGPYGWGTLATDQAREIIARVEGDALIPCNERAREQPLHAHERTRRRAPLQGGGPGRAPGRTCVVSAALTFRGTVGRVIFCNRESGWMTGVLDFDEETAKREGKNSSPFAGDVAADQGDRLEVVGTWTEHPKFGPQIKVASGIVKMDDSPNALAHLLATDKRFKGLGPARAKRVVASALQFSDAGDMGQALADHPNEISAAAKCPLDAVVLAGELWNERRSYFEAIAALGEQGWSNAQANSIVVQFGDNAPAMVKSDPYFLIGKIARFGFRTVDAVAQNMGVHPTDPLRLFAGVAYCIDRVGNDGHTWTTRAGLVEDAVQELRPDTLDGEVKIEDALEKLIEERVVHVDVSPTGKEIVASAHVAGIEFEAFETLIAGLQDRGGEPLHLDDARTGNVMDVIQTLNDGQRAALEGFSTFRFGVISGGAGVGKTYMTRAICEVASENELMVALCAPTGKAARKLAHATGRIAKTIHRLLEPKFNSGTGLFQFTRHEGNKLEEHLVIVDEISMVDVPLMRSLLAALGKNTRLLLVGDHHQIPSVGAGAVLRDILSARDRFPGAIHVLTEIVRQAGILARNTTALLDGVVVKQDSPSWGIVRTEKGDRDGSSAIVTQIVEHLLSEPCPDPFGRQLNRDFDVQVLAPMRKGPLGTYELNVHLQRLHQNILGNAPPPPTEQNRPPKPLVGDRVIWTKNDYELGLLNGTQAIVTGLPKGGSMELFVEDGHEVTVPPEKRNRVEVAYAMTIHKSQGSEWPAVVLIASSSHWRMHDRNLLYTGAARAAEWLTIVGDDTGLAHFAKERKSHARQTFGGFLVHGWVHGDGRPTTASVRVTSERKDGEPLLDLGKLPW